jgi:hypothetical protein
MLKTPPKPFTTPKGEREKPPTDPMPENDPEALVAWGKRNI